MAKFIYFRNSSTDAVAINVDKVTDLSITAASGSAKLSVNYVTNANGDGSVTLDTDDSVKAGREIARVCSLNDSRFVTIGDDDNNHYIDGVSAVNTISHS